ncbi:MAG: sodium ion-translocating decarboxylase subunit beta [Ruminococcaceae bacterium]|nr:sodium ion-translocating decarboxylase subunit beta [Oscillospiraceae bacterium]
MDIIGSLVKLWEQSGFVSADWKQLVMIGIACVLLYLGIVKEFEPLLMVGIAFGMLLSNLPLGGMYNPDLWVGEVSYSAVLQTGGILDFFYIGIKTGLFPSLIFMGVGAMTDFGPMIANPKSMLLGAAAQLGIYMAFILAVLVGFTPNVAASIGIIGGADGPTAIWLTKILAPEYLAPIAIAAYSYMALIPLIQPPIMKAFTTKAEREIKMDQLRPVSKTEKIVFPIIVTIVTCIILPSVTPLLGCFMLGNLFRETGVTERLSDTIQNALMNIITLMLSTAVGATAVAENFLKLDTILIIVLGLAAFSFSTFGGIILGKVMCKISKGKINPLIGSAGVSAVPMAARVSQIVGQKANPSNYLLMHAMGPNVSGVIGSAVAAGFLLAVFG